MADGELNPREAERVVWDVIVVGTGMGGGMLGYSLARSGRRVLFVEKGRSTLPGASGTIRSAIPDCRFGTDPKTSVLDPQNRAHEMDANDRARGCRGAAPPVARCCWTSCSVLLPTHCGRKTRVSRFDQGLNGLTRTPNWAFRIGLPSDRESYLVGLRLTILKVAVAWLAVTAHNDGWHNLTGRHHTRNEWPRCPSNRPC